MWAVQVRENRGVNNDILRIPCIKDKEREAYLAMVELAGQYACQPDMETGFHSSKAFLFLNLKGDSFMVEMVKLQSKQL